MKKIQFQSSFDTTSMVVTVLSLLLIIYLGYDLYNMPDDGATRTMFLLIAFVLLFFSFFMNSGVYEIREGELVLQRPIAPIHIAFADIDSTQVLTGNSASLMRVFGIGGMGGWYGKFWNSDLGFVTMMGRNQQNLLLIRTRSKGSIIICPDDLSIQGYITKYY